MPMVGIWNVAEHYCQLASLILHTNVTVFYVLTFIAVLRLLWGTDRYFRFSFSFAPQKRWMQRFCRLILVAMVLCEMTVIYQGLHVYVADTNPRILGAVTMTLFFLVAWVYLWLIDVIWFIVLIILGTIKRFCHWMW